MESEEITKESVVLEELRGRWSVKKQTGTGEAGLRFLEFGDVDRYDVKALRLETGAGIREGSWENDGAAKGEGISSMGLSGIDVDPVVNGERPGIKPGAIGKKRVAPDVGGGGFQMQAAGDRHGDDFVLVRSKDGSELANAFGVAAPSEADEKFAADAKDVAALESAGKGDVGELSKGRKGFGERGRFGAARLRA